MNFTLKIGANGQEIKSPDIVWGDITNKEWSPEWAKQIANFVKSEYPTMRASYAAKISGMSGRAEAYDGKVRVQYLDGVYSSSAALEAREPPIKRGKPVGAWHFIVKIDRPTSPTQYTEFSIDAAGKQAALKAFLEAVADLDRQHSPEALDRASKERKRAVEAIYGTKPTENTLARYFNASF